MDSRDEDQTDGQGTTEAIRLLERFSKEKRPFFLAMGYFRPHVPFVAPKKYFDLYPKETIKLAGGPADDLNDVPKPAITIRPSNYGLSESDLKDCKRAYFAAVSFVDSQVGRLLEGLEQAGLKDNTIVVFVSDHGFLLGEHGQWQKQSLFEEAARVPLVFAGPKISGRGASPRTVEMLDIYPTLVELCGLPSPKHKLEGKSLKPLLDDPAIEWDRPAYSQVQRGTDQTPSAPPLMGRSVRTQRWRYTEWDDGKAGVELYDHENDAHEYKNLANDGSQADVVASMKRLLHRIDKQEAKPTTSKQLRREKAT